MQKKQMFNFFVVFIGNGSFESFLIEKWPTNFRGIFSFGEHNKFLLTLNLEK